MEKMTIHRGLAELKLIDSKILKQIDQLIPVGIKQKDKLVNGQFDEDSFNRNAQSGYDSITSLIERKMKIKSAIVLKNAETKIKIGNKEMTISDAINLKSTIIVKKQFVEQMNSKYAATLRILENNNNTVESNCQTIISSTFGKDNVKIQSTDVENVRKPYMEMHKFNLVNPIKIEQKIKDLENEISVFEADIDATLSEINATTFIEI